MFFKDIPGLILAGGSNRRFPYLKSFIKVRDRLIIDIQLDLLKGFFSDVIISTNTPEEFFKFNTKLVGDIYISSGPLSGILSGMLNTGADSMFVLACDMPFVRKEVVELILSNKQRAKIVVCKFNNKLQPLLGIYNKGLIEDIEAFIRAGNIRIIDFIEQTTDVYIIEEDKIKEIDPKGCSFVNINTPEEYNKYIGGRICLD